MTRTPFDQFSKQLFQEFLSPLGEVRVNEEIPGEPRYVDIWFTPSNQPQTDSNDLGILAQIAEYPCLLEPFRKQPTEIEIHSCVFKLYHLEAQIIRDAKQDEDKISSEILPRLWIITTSCTDKLLNDLGATTQEGWPDGVYFLAKILKTQIIAVDRLPKTPETLCLRILGKGLTQKQAVDEVIALPKDSEKRQKILQLLSTWKISIELSSEIDVEERELIMNLSQAYLEWEQKTVARGREEGRENERRELLENLLTARFGEVDSELRTIIQSILSLSVSEYAAFLLQLPNLSREDLITGFGN
jgi:hypothetical protein